MGFTTIVDIRKKIFQAQDIKCKHLDISWKFLNQLSFPLLEPFSTHKYIALHICLKALLSLRTSIQRRGVESLQS